MARVLTAAADAEELPALARRARWLVMETVAGSGAGHVGGPLSAMDLLVELYFRQLRIRPDQPDWPDRDRFILSKGHSAIALYAVLALRGFFPVEELATFDQLDSRLQGHPDLTRLPGLDASTGSLGQGVAVGIGHALAARLSGRAYLTWVMVGDGELQEGMIWESAHVATRYRLGHLAVVVDWNGLQQYGWPACPGSGQADGGRAAPWGRGELPAMFTSFGWRVLEIDGHDFGQIETACAEVARQPAVGPPVALLARTVKGRGVSFAEGDYTWHARVPDAAALAQARADLGIGTDLGIGIGIGEAGDR
jgi:transketolase